MTHAAILPTRPKRSPFARDGNNKLVRRSYWLDMNDRTLMIVMTNGFGTRNE
jgi:hypothetical protein